MDFETAYWLATVITAVSGVFLGYYAGAGVLAILTAISAAGFVFLIPTSGGWAGETWFALAFFLPPVVAFIVPAWLVKGGLYVRDLLAYQRKVGGNPPKS